MKVKPTYTAKQTNVYHNSSKCTERNNIEKGNVKHGTGGHKRCERCKDRES